MFRQWTALELAIHHQWGGPQGQVQASALVEEVMTMFLGPELIYKDDVAILLEDFMETYFNTILEDGSGDELGDLLCVMWRNCSIGDFTMVQEIMRKESLRPQILQQSRGLETGGDILDSDDEAMDEDGCASSTVFHQAFAHELEMLKEEEENSPEMDLVDEDGFERVVVGKKKKGKGGAK